VTSIAGTARHWDDAYRQGDTTRSWFQQRPEPSLQLIRATGAGAADGIIDVGGGASPLAGALLDHGFTAVTVLDISATGLRTAQGRLGSRSAGVEWLVADLLGDAWQPLTDERHEHHTPAGGTPSFAWATFRRRA
jgi:hypothetical protein